MKIFNLFLICSILSISTAYAATLNVSMRKNAQYYEESIELPTNKGLVSIYTVNLSWQQVNTLSSLKKGHCVQIKAKDQNLEEYKGSITIMEPISAKKVTCKR